MLPCQSYLLHHFCLTSPPMFGSLGSTSTSSYDVVRQLHEHFHPFQCRWTCLTVIAQTGTCERHSAHGPRDTATACSGLEGGVSHMTWEDKNGSCRSLFCGYVKMKMNQQKTLKTNNQPNKQANNQFKQSINQCLSISTSRLDAVALYWRLLTLKEAENCLQDKLSVQIHREKLSWIRKKSPDRCKMQKDLRMVLFVRHTLTQHIICFCGR